MTGDDQFIDLTPAPPTTTMLTAGQVANGPSVSPFVIISGYSPDEWETFVEDWLLYGRKAQYLQLGRPTGSGDKGIDIAGYTDKNQLLGVWDNYQCKHYDSPLTPGNAWPEIGKILWYSFQGDYVPPRKYYFCAPKGIGTKLTLLLSNKVKLKSEAIKYWVSLGSKVPLAGSTVVPLEEDFSAYVNAFDFSIFGAVELSAIVAEHKASSPNHISRFGGGPPPRPKVGPLPAATADSEARYTRKLFDAYEDHKKSQVLTEACLTKWREIAQHYQRQREAFYHAESLRVFVRESFEEGTYVSLQKEIFHAVIDTHDDNHPDGFSRVKAVTKAAQDLPLDGHPLASCVLTLDKRGICHQLANENDPEHELVWVQK
ncbi:ABC-three component system protein [Azospirillum sp. TSH64]|uniref:ABC-three component system protein n=1 Tax=Azospirillum sp. TSH64 TaxID=652740 RepID=UPI000D6079EE|nr:ABC-three component system protein [Azospirillum sp. TSH64]PWC74509.1 hypothetical protein TSH64_05520 [Azospirillum sp. TSH64]